MLPVHVTGIRIALLAYTAALWLPGLFCLWRIPRCPATGPRADSRCPAVRRRVSVIVPARNEERRIAPLLESLDRQNRRVDEILVVDDGSTDGTAMLARRLGAKVIAAGVTPGGWTGKNWACWSGARAARGNLFVFLSRDRTPLQKSPKALVGRDCKLTLRLGLVQPRLGLIPAGPSLLQSGFRLAHAGLSLLDLGPQLPVIKSGEQLALLHHIALRCEHGERLPHDPC